MRKLILILLLLPFLANAQINISKPYRTNGSVMVGDSALFIGQFKLPSFTTQTLNGYAAKAGQSFGLNLPDSTLSIYMGSGFTKFANKTYVVNGLNSKLSIAGGTMTGGLTGTTANFTTSGRFAQLGIGAAPVAGINIYNVANLTGATSVTGNFTASTIQSGVTGQAIMYRSTPSTVASAFTLPTLIHYYSDQGTFGAGSTVTSQFGFYANSNMVGATNNYGFFGSIPSGANRWNLFMGGTAQNYLAGNIGIGIQAPLAYLNIKAGTSTANTAPIKLTAGTHLATPENGAMEYDGTNLFFTPSATTRKTITYLEDLRVVNTTTTALSSATLNSTYPGVPIGYRVICHLITGAPAIYTKATENGSSDVWLTTTATTTP